MFSRPGTAAAAKEEETGWKESLYKFYKSGQQSMRVAVYGCKHDAGMFEELLKVYCELDPAETLGNAMIDTACLNAPKVAAPAHACVYPVRGSFTDNGCVRARRCECAAAVLYVVMTQLCTVAYERLALMEIGYPKLEHVCGAAVLCGVDAGQHDASQPLHLSQL